MQGHVSERDHMRLQEKVYRVTDLVTADATRPSDDLLTESGQIYLCIRQAFAAAFDELLEQVSILLVHPCDTLCLSLNSLKKDFFNKVISSSRM